MTDYETKRLLKKLIESLKKSRERNKKNVNEMTDEAWKKYYEGCISSEDFCIYALEEIVNL